MAMKGRIVQHVTSKKKGIIPNTEQATPDRKIKVYWDDGTKTIVQLIKLIAIGFQD